MAPVEKAKAPKPKTTAAAKQKNVAAAVIDPASNKENVESANGEDRVC